MRLESIKEYLSYLLGRDSSVLHKDILHKEGATLERRRCYVKLFSNMIMYVKFTANSKKINMRCCDSFTQVGQGNHAPGRKTEVHHH